MDQISIITQMFENLSDHEKSEFSNTSKLINLIKRLNHQIIRMK